jgi:hypothetical protein
MRFFLPLLAALLLAIVACQTIPELSTPVITKTTPDTDKGGTLRLNWTSIANAEGYHIYYDGHTTADTSITGTQIDISTPRTKIEVAAYKGSTVSEKALVDATPVTATVTVYFISVATHPEHALTFSADGSCIATALGSGIEFVLDDTTTYQGSTFPGFWSPDMYPTPYNTHDNSAAPSAGTDFNAVTAAPAPGTYLTRREITQGPVYPLWVDPDGLGYTTDDHFAKALVQSIDVNGTITLKVAYQKIVGLRWLKTT